MNKMNLARTINAVIWAVAAIILIILVYKTWSGYGLYNLYSFFASLFFHGGFCLFFGFLFDRAIRNYFNK